MSRSHKEPYGPAGSNKMKDWKKGANKKLRRIAIDSTEELKNSLYKRKSDIWDSPSDGKMYYGDKDKYKRK